MNAPARIRTRRPVHRNDYRKQVEIRRPGASGEEVELLCSVALMSDRAQARLIWCTREAGIVWQHIIDLAEICLSESVPLEQLRDIRLAIIRLGTIAVELARLFPAASAEEGAVAGE